jgi:hypothetical protein
MDILSKIISDMNPKDQTAFRNLSSKDLNHDFIIHSLEAAKHSFDRAQSLQIVRSVNLQNKINEMYGNSPIFPITLTFHQHDAPSLKELDLLSLIRRVGTVVFEGDERTVVEASHSEIGASTVLNGANQWDIEMYNAWERPSSLRGILSSETVTAVKSLNLQEEIAFLVIELSWFVTEGDMNWTVMKTCRLHAIQREGIAAEEILIDEKLRNIDRLTLIEFDRSVLVNVSVLANLKNLNYLDLSLTEIVDVSALAKLTNLKALALSYTKVVDVSALVNLTNLKSLYLNGQNVDVSALTKMLPKLDVFQ